MSGEDVTDPLQEAREQCKETACEKFVKAMMVCTERVQSRKHTEETCHDEVIDLMTCVDHCAVHKAFKMLK